MSIILKGRRTGVLSIHDGVDTLKQTFVFYCDAGEGIEQLVEDSQFPNEGERLENFPYLRCTSVRVIPEMGGKKNFYKAECIYSNEQGTIPLTEDDLECRKAYNLTIRPVENVIPFDVAYDAESSTNTPTVPVQTTSGSPLYATTCTVSALMRFTYYLRHFEPEWVISKTGTLNADQMKICGITVRSGHALLRNMTASCRRIGRKDRVRIDMEIEISYNGFARIFANRSIWCLDRQGNRHRIFSGISAATGNTIFGPYKDLARQCLPNTPILPVDESVWLLKDGTIDPNNGVRTTADGPFQLKFRDKRLESWKELSLPSGAEW